MTAVERAIRYAGYTVIGIFLLAFAAFVGTILFQAVQRNPHAVVEFLTIPGCWIIFLGPILLWIALVIFYFRLPKDIRGVYVTTEYRRGFSPAAVAGLFREYRRIHGFDWLLWLVTASAIVLVIIVFLSILGW